MKTGKMAFAVMGIVLAGVLAASAVQLPAAQHSKALNPLLERARTEPIPVVWFHSGVASDCPVTTAATNNIAAAALAAEKLPALSGDQGEIAGIVHDQTSRTGIDRRDGFL